MDRVFGTHNLRPHGCEFACEGRQTSYIAFGAPNLISDVAPLDIADPRQLSGNLEIRCWQGGAVEEHADTRQALLGEGGDRPRRRPAEERNEPAPPHS